MAYALDINLALGAGNTGLTLEMQLKDTAGVNVGAAVTSGFVEFGATGNYLFHSAAWPDSHRGAAVFQVSPGGLVKACVAINPQEVENPDIKTSTRSSHTAADVWAAGSRTLTSFGTLVADVATAVWAAGARTLTSFGTLVADTATAVWASVTRTLTSVASITAADVWAYATRTLTQSAAQVAAVVSGSDLVCKRGDTFTAPLTGIGALTGRTKLWFTVKGIKSHPDSAALIQIVEGTGLTVLNGAAATASQGSLTVTDASLGNVTVVLDEEATALLRPSARYYYDIQMLSASGVLTRTEGDFSVTEDITRSLT